jgi:hypothetical protein
MGRSGVYAAAGVAVLVGGGAVGLHFARRRLEQKL